MKTKIEVLGEISEDERVRLEFVVKGRGWNDLIPGDGVQISEKPGQPPKIAYLNRRIHIGVEQAEYKLVFEVGSGVKATKPVQIDQKKLFTELIDFVTRKSAVFNRPDMAARELTNFFTTYVQGG